MNQNLIKNLTTNIDINNLTVEEYTSPEVTSIAPDETLSHALMIMREKDIRHLPVEDNGDIVGIISERDILTFLSDDDMLARDIMNSNLLCANITDNLGKVAYKLSKEKKGSALILDENNKLYGIFTTTDALNALVEIFLVNRY